MHGRRPPGRRIAPWAAALLFGAVGVLVFSGGFDGHPGPSSASRLSLASQPAAPASTENTTFPGNASSGCSDCSGSVSATLPPIPYSGGNLPNELRASGASRAATPAAGLFGYTGHYWLVGTYSGSSFAANDVYASAVVPNIGPRSGDLFYEDLSIWDNTGGYDQIGITSDYQTGTSPSTSTDDWNFNWVHATSCGTYYVYGTGGNWDPDAGNLSPGMAYTFEIRISGGLLQFNVYEGDGNPGTLTELYSITQSTSATYLAASETTSCGGAVSYGYAVYEEVYDTQVQPFPNWDFNFSNNHANGNYVTSWGAASVCDSSLSGACPVPTSPHGYSIWEKSGWAFVTIANQAFSFQNAPYLTAFASPGSTQGGLYESAFIVGGYCRSNTCYDAGGAYSMPSGWSGSVTFAPFLTSSPAVSAISFTVPSGTATGQYYDIWIQLQLSSSTGGPVVEFTSMMVYVYVS